jgi:5-hydroxyisourate hydrolase
MADMGRLTTHVLDTAHGCPGAGITLRLYAENQAQVVLIGEARTNADGRCDAPLLSGEQFATGRYRIDFEVGDYFRARGVALADPAFLETVSLRFGIADAAAHYHVPLLVSPFSYSTYRGS